MERPFADVRRGQSAFTCTQNALRQGYLFPIRRTNLLFFKPPNCICQGGEVDQRESEMMAVRWRTFVFQSQISQEEQRVIPPCPRCFASFVLSGKP
jgi:hypothetical protein